MVNKRALAATLVAAFAVSGCATTTKVERINGNQFIVCDSGSSSCDGSNPEKGLPKTCFAIGRQIDSYRVLKSDKLLVSCGAVRPEILRKRAAAKAATINGPH